MFNEKKTTQIAAFFLRKDPRKCMPYLKLIKLLYLADREAIYAFGYTMSGDRLVSMKHGPVLSTALDLIRGKIASQGIWKQWIQKDGYNALLRVPFVDLSPLDELSLVELDILDSLHKRFGKMHEWEIVQWTHTHCEEWQFTSKSPIPIAYRDIARLRFDEATAQAIEAQIQADDALDRRMAVA